MNFKVGQKVVCVKSAPDNLPMVDKIYIINNIDYCACGKPAVDVGINMTYDTTSCSCGRKTRDGIRWFGTFRFAPLEYNSAHDEIIEKFPLTEEVPDTPIKEPQI